jgi:hypothetical protein
VQEANHKLSDFNAQNLANTLWAMATFRHQDDALMLSIADRVMAKDCYPMPMTISSFSHSLALLSLPMDHEFYNWGSKMLDAEGADLEAQVICNTLHGHAMIGLYCNWAIYLMLDKLPLLLVDGHDSIHKTEHERSKLLEGNRQVFQYMMMLEAKGSLLEDEVRSGSRSDA